MISFNKLNTYEKEQWSAIEAWKNEAPGVMGAAINYITSPATWLVQKVIPSGIIQKVLETSHWFASGLSDCGDLLKEVGIKDISELKEKRLEFCDQLSHQVNKWAIRMAIAEGGASGFTGLPGLIADVPAIITLALGTVQKTGHCYGYDFKTAMDKQFVMGILSVSGANSKKEKMDALRAIHSIVTTMADSDEENMPQKKEQRKFSKESQLVAGSLAKQLGANLSKRKALQTIPVVGIGIGASANGWYIKDVGKAARRIFQERWLIDKQYRESSKIQGGACP